MSPSLISALGTSTVAAGLLGCLGIVQLNVACLCVVTLKWMAASLSSGMQLVRELLMFMMSMLRGMCRLWLCSVYTMLPVTRLPVVQMVAKLLLLLSTWYVTLQLSLVA